MRFGGHVEHMEVMMNVYKIFIKNLSGRWHRWKDNIESRLKINRVGA
jgi:hypothetical protein